MSNIPCSLRDVADRNVMNLRNILNSLTTSYAVISYKTNILLANFSGGPLIPVTSALPAALEEDTTRRKRNITGGYDIALMSLGN